MHVNDASWYHITRGAIIHRNEVQGRGVAMRVPQTVLMALLTSSLWE